MVWRRTRGGTTTLRRCGDRAFRGVFLPARGGLLGRDRIGSGTSGRRPAGAGSGGRQVATQQRDDKADQGAICAATSANPIADYGTGDATPRCDNRRRTRGAGGKRMLRQGGEKLERVFAGGGRHVPHNCARTGGNPQTGCCCRCSPSTWGSATVTVLRAPCKV